MKAPLPPYNFCRAFETFGGIFRNLQSSLKKSQGFGADLSLILGKSYGLFA
jgi:hypothetical protein